MFHGCIYCVLPPLLLGYAVLVHGEERVFSLWLLMMLNSSRLNYPWSTFSLQMCWIAMIGALWNCAGEFVVL